MELVKVRDDLFHIARRIKQIDSQYELYFNRKLWRFEVYAKGAMQVALPFDRLDARSVDFVRETRIENLSRIMDEIEKNNAVLDALKEKNAREKTYALTEEILC